MMNRVSSPWLVRWAAASAALVSVGGHADAQVQDATLANAPSADVIVVTAQRRSEDVQSVAISIQALSEKLISDLGIRSTDQIAQLTPNVQIGEPNGFGLQPIITIRGVGLNDYSTNNPGPNGVYTDEVYISAPAAQTFDTFDLERIEVLKGPQGTLYGRNASGGAINFISAKPTDALSEHLHVETSSFNTANVEGAVGGSIVDGLSGRIAATYNYSDGYERNLLSGRRENGVNNYAIRGQLRWAPQDDFSALLSVSGGEVNNRPTDYRHIGVFVPGSFDPATFNFTLCSPSQALAGQCVDATGYGTNKNFYQGAWNREQNLKVNNSNAALHLEWQPGDIKLTSITAFQHNDSFRPEDADASPYSVVEDNAKVAANTITQEVRLSESMKRFNWVTGAYLLNETLKQDQPLYLFVDWDTVFGAHAGDGLAEKSIDYAKQTTNSYALYGQGDYALTEAFKVTLGGRYTQERKTFDINETAQFQENGYQQFGPYQPLWSFAGLKQSSSAFNFRVAPSYQLSANAMTYVSAASGFKSGDFNGGFLSNSPAEAARQLAPVAPEKVTAYEVGAKSTWFDKRLIANLAVFYNDYRDEQVFVEILPVPGGTGVPLNVLDNAPKAHTQGLDAEFVGKPVDGLSLTADFGLLDATVDQFTSHRTTVVTDFTGHTLPNAPKFSFSGIIDYRRPVARGELSLQASANQRTRQYFDLANSPLTSQDGYWIENLRLAYLYEPLNVEAALFVRNLSNQQYANYAYDLSNPFGLVQQDVGPPRSVGVSLDYRY